MNSNAPSPPVRRTLAAAAAALIATTVTLFAPWHSEPASAAGTPASVVPRVTSWTPTSGTYTLSSTSRVVVDAATASSSTSGPTSPLTSTRTLSQVAAKLRADLQAVTGKNLTVVTGATASAGDITVTLSNSDSTLGVAGYRIQVTDRVSVTAPTSTGVFNASRTILQMLRTDPGNDNLDAGTIRDLPSLSHRAISIDVGRRYWKISQIQDLIRQMSWHKLNLLQLHFNESEAFRLYSPTYAGIAPTDPAMRYSQADIAAIEAVAAEHHITVVPEIDMPAHATAIALGAGTNRSLGPQCGSSYTWVLDYIDQSTRAWANTMLQKFVSWFSGPYFHIGNDEVPHGLANCAYVQNAITTDPDIDNFEELQERFANELNTTVKQAGKRTMMWANASNILPDNDIIMVNFGSDANAANLRGLGYDVLNTAYNTGSYTRFFVIPAAFGDARHVARGNIYNWTPATPGGHNLGQQLAVWADEEFFADSRYFIDEIDPRRAELAERTWNATATTVTLNQFHTRVEAVGAAPGVDTIPPARSSNGLPDHHYTFDSNFTPTSATHFPAAYTHPTAADSAGGLHASSYSQNAPSFPVAGYLSNGARFTAAGTDRFSIGGADLPPPWSVATWIRRETNGTDTQLMRSWTGAIKVEQYQTTNKLGMTAYGVEDYSFDYTVPLNQWTHIALVATPSGTTLYANGQPVQTIAQTIDLPQGAIGGNRAFGGTLDELKIYDEALSAGQVAALYSSYTAPTTNLALGRPVTASSQETASFPAENAVDGSGSTRWSSLRTDPQWIEVDLGAVYSIDRVRLDWEAAYGRDYLIQTSTDGTSWTTISTVAGGDGGVDDLTGLSGSGRYVRMYGTARGTSYGYSLWELAIYGTAANLASGRPVTASSQETASFPVENAVDGSGSTRWSSLRTDPQWIEVDLGAVYSIDRVRLDWEAAYGRDYLIQTSTDGTSWTTISTVAGGDGGVDDLTGLSGSGRYVRMYGTARGTSYGYSLWELAIYGT